MPKDQEDGSQGALDLDCADCIRAASFAPAPGGEFGVFSCSIGPLADETVAALDRAANAHRPVRLLFSKRPLLLSLVSIERKEPRSVRIVGQVMPAIGSPAQ